MRAYILFYVTCVVTTLFLFITKSDNFVLFSKRYWKFLTKPWKVIVFVFSGSIVTFSGPLTIDPTWTWVTGGMMSILTFLTAPWVVGELYFAVKKRCFAANTFVAVSTWLFSASWFYDFYLLQYHGWYPSTWAANLVLSSILYLAAGIMWNLDWVLGNGPVLSFHRPGWPQTESNSIPVAILWILIPFFLLGLAFVVPALKFMNGE